MWISPDAVREALARSGTTSATVSAETTALAHRKAAKERAIYALGKAECDSCGEEIWYHPQMNAAGWTWESEHLIGWCDSSKDKRHRPKIVIEEDE